MREPRLTLRGRPAFHVCGLIGLAAAVTVCGAVLRLHGVPLWALPLLAVTGVTTFLALVLAVKVVTGRESLVYYHHEIAVLAACAVAARAASLPVAASLDAVVLGVGAFLACGRIGCFNAGCCYGRPAHRGVRYGHRHAAAGFPARLVGRPLIPVQLIEAAMAAAITAAGVGLVAAGAAPGAALTLYVAVYGVARFVLEECRGDDDRRRPFGFTQAQWTSLALTAGATLAPGPLRAAAATAAVLIGLMMLVRRRAGAATRFGSERVDSPRRAAV